MFIYQLLHIMSCARRVRAISVIHRSPSVYLKQVLTYIDHGLEEDGAPQKRVRARPRAAVLNMSRSVVLRLIALFVWRRCYRSAETPALYCLHIDIV